MSGSVTCPSCSRGIPVQPGGRLPPWCSGCGASLSAAVAASPERLAAPIPPPAPKLALPKYFQACVPQVLQHERLTTFRFYVVADELLVFPAGLGSIRDGQFIPVTRVSKVIGGIGHGASQISSGMRANDLRSIDDNENLAKLEGSSDEVLAEMARITPGAAAIPAAELPSVRIESPGMLFSLFRGIKCEATLKLGHRHFGTLALPSLTDARRAVEGLKSLLGGGVTVNLPWGKRS